MNLHAPSDSAWATNTLSKHGLHYRQLALHANDIPVPDVSGLQAGREQEYIEQMRPFA